MTEVQAYRLSASEVTRHLKSGSLTLGQYVRSLKTRYDDRDRTIQAWVEIDWDKIIASAEALDAIPAVNRGPLYGVITGVKDVILTQGRYTYLVFFPKTHSAPSQRFC